MHRTESDNYVEIGGERQFTDGPPGTTLGANDVNVLFEELIYLVEQNGLTLKTVATETNQQVYDAVAAQIATSVAANPLYSVNFEAKDLLINVAGVTTVTVTAKRLAVLNNSFIPTFLDDLDTTFDITTDLMSGTSEKTSTWYQLWIDSLGARLMVPDIEGTADTNTLNSLEDSTADFITEKVSVGDIVYNMTDRTIGYVGSIIALDELGIVDADGNDLDLFPLGTEDYKIHMLSPTGLGAYKANIGMAYNDSGDDLSDSGYTRPELQEKIIYEGDTAGNKDFTFSSTQTITAIQQATIALEQKFLFSMLPSWAADIKLSYSISSATFSIEDVTITGISLSAETPCSVSSSNAGLTWHKAYFNPALPGPSSISSGATITAMQYSGTLTLLAKPTFGTRS